MKNYRIVYDDMILRQLKHLEKNLHLKRLLTKIFDKIEEKGVNA